MNDLSKTIRGLLAVRGMSMEDLAAGTGLSVISILDQVQGRSYLHRRARKIENFLGAAVWTSVARFTELNRASEILGADAVTVDFHELRRRAIALGVPNARKLTSKDRLADAVLGHFPDAK